jgi:tetratricopeptide (TPR) repeat protein/mono/diheme cytochrome c family protein
MLKIRGPVLGAALTLTLATAAQAAEAAPTFAKDIAPLLYARCASCHQPDGDAPFSLISYDEVRRRATQIAEVTKRRYMPPWKPGEPGTFLGERRLTEQEIERIQEWVAAGTPQGQADDAPVPPRASSAWLLGAPDLLLTLPRYTLDADGLDVFRNFVVSVPGAGTHYVRGLEFRPGSRAVHHANIRIDPTSASRRLDDADPAPGYEGVILHTADYPDGHFLGWTPGQAPPLASRDLAWRLDGGNDLVVQLHMRPTGRPETVAPMIGLYFSPDPPSRTPAIVRLGRQNIEIAAGATDYRVTDSFVLPVDAEVMAVQPHAHYRARSVRAWATLPDRTERSLIRIADWDFNWQDQYRYASPFWLPTGSTLHMEYVFDNSDANPRNPSHPPETVSWGWRSSDEMADVWIQMMTRSDTDRLRLARVAHRKMAVEDAVGSEVLIAREPGYVSLRNDAALIYMDLGQPAKALEHFAAVTRLQPEAPTAWYNEGVALEAMGDATGALSRYGEALRLDPAYSAAHNNLANVLQHEGRMQEAIGHYRDAVRLDPANVEAHCAFARVLTETGDPIAATAEYRAAIAVRPDWTPCLINFSWLLSAHADARVRQPQEAIRLAERAADLTGRQDPNALDALAAAYAAAGRFDEAVAAGEAAIARAQDGAGPGRADDIRARVELYRRRTAFIVPN